MKSIDKWSAEELAAQCIMPRISSDAFFSDPGYKLNAIRLAEAGVCGFCVFAGETNQTRQMISELQASAAVPLIFSADFEHGLLMRLSEGAPFSHAMNLGVGNDPETTFKIGELIGKESLFAGVTWNLAPVCDINSNQANPIINIRSFGENREIVSKHCTEFTKGLQSGKVMACAKHFPGHGDTEIDSHIELPVLRKSLEELEQNELIPFNNAILAGVKSIMTAHIMIPDLCPDGMPVSLSATAINYLRQEMEFKGIIVTDALDMGAISKLNQDKTPGLAALLAGNDLALLPADPAVEIINIARAARNNLEFHQELKEKVKKLISAKRWCGLTTTSPMLEAEETKSFGRHEQLALKAAYRGIRISGDESLLPLDEEMQFAGLALISEQMQENSVSFFKLLAQATENNSDFGFIDQTISDEQLADLNEQMLGAELLIIAVFAAPSAGKSLLRSSYLINNLSRKLLPNSKKIVILTGNPYYDGQIECDLLIKTYSDSLSAVAATVMKLTGRQPSEYNY